MFLFGKEADAFMRKEILSVFRNQNLECAALWDKLSLEKRKFFLLFFLSLVGLFSGIVFCLWSAEPSGRQIVPLFFSGVPVPETGFFSCFSTVLLKSFLFLTAVFLLGFTAFGTFAIPILLLFKGAFIGIAVSSTLWVDGLSGLGKYAVFYTPCAAAALLLLLFLGEQGMAFSKQFRKSGLSLEQEGISFRFYGAEYIGTLCVSVLFSFFGAALAALSAVFFVS